MSAFPTFAISRRMVLSGLSASALTAALPGSAMALAPETARQLVAGLVAEVNAVIDSGASEAAMLAQFERIFDRYADVPTIARYSLGADARRASAAQMSRYTAAFKTYVAHKYGRRFREFIGSQIVPGAARPVKTWIEVNTTVDLRGRDPFTVDFHVSDAAGRPLFFNIIIEGVNMLLAERTEIGAMLDRRGGNIDALIADLS